MFEKLGITLASEGFEVAIVGFPSQSQPNHPTIQFYPHPSFSRFSIKRFFIPWLIFRKIRQLKADVIIINTPELLFMAALNRLFFGSQIIYDVLENYYSTIRYTNAYPSFIRLILAYCVRITESLFSFCVTQFLFAEKGYVKELSFARNPLVLENKLPKSVANQYIRGQVRESSKLLFTGTLAPTTGIFEAISLCKELHKIDSAFTLTIVGYCAIPEVLEEIKSEIGNSPFIKLIGGDSLVPHGLLLNEIKQADIGIIIYPHNPSTHTSISTKLYEYLALNLPILIRHNSESHELVQICRAGVILDNTIDFHKLANTLRNISFSLSVPDSIFWEAEAQKLIRSLKIK